MQRMNGIEYAIRIRRLLAVVIAGLSSGLLFGCLSTPQPRYSTPGPVYVSRFHIQPRTFGDLSVELHTAVKRRLARVGIRVVNDPSGAYQLQMNSRDEADADSPGCAGDLCVSFYDPQGQLIDGPEPVELRFGDSMVRLAPSSDEEEKIQRRSVVEGIAKQIVRRFFRVPASASTA